MKSNGGFVDQDIPQISNMGGSDGAVVIRHKEFIMDIKSATTFNILGQFPLNPGSSQTFPWLSKVARNFTQWQPQGISFEFKSTSGSLASTQALGEVVFATNYNAGDKPFTSKQQMMNEIFSASGAPSANMSHPIECDPNQSTIKHLYVSSDTVPADQPVQFYNLGNTYIAAQGQSFPDVALGELWITYQIALFKPQLPSVDHNDAGNYQHLQYELPAFNGAVTAFPLPSLWKQREDSDLIVIPTQTYQLRFVDDVNDRRYLMVFSWTNDGTSIDVYRRAALGAGLLFDSNGSDITLASVFTGSSSIQPRESLAPTIGDGAGVGGVFTRTVVVVVNVKAGYVENSRNMNFNTPVVSATVGTTDVGAVDILITELPWES